MITYQKIRKVLRAGRQRLGGRAGQVKGRPVPGIPPGLSFEGLNETCLRHTGHPLRQAWHTPLSNWKSTCATYRLLLQPLKGRRWTVIYKDATYESSQAALAGLPVNPGPPEYAVYTNTHNALARYLPTVYLYREVVRGEHYQYLLEDLSDAYQKNVQPAGILTAATLLPDLHEALRQWVAQASSHALLRYNESFTLGLLEYARAALDRYCRLGDSSYAREFCGRWTEIARVYQAVYRTIGPGQFPIAHPIHGDFNITNILFHKKEAGRIKILDWEWTGLGLPQADLASLLNAASPAQERAVLENYCARVNNGSIHEHWRSYAWCKLQRGLLDASFTAQQVLENPAPGPRAASPRFNRQKFIELALQRSLQAFEALGS